MASGKRRFHKIIAAAQNGVLHGATFFVQLETIWSRTRGLKPKHCETCCIGALHAAMLKKVAVFVAKN